MESVNNIKDRITTDNLLKNLSLIVGSPSTISLYLVLVIVGQMRYGELISTRKQLMKLSGISSTQTYHKAINILVEKRLLVYSPSFAPMGKSSFILLP